MKRLLYLIAILTVVIGGAWGVYAIRSGDALPDSERERLEFAFRALNARDDESFERIRESFRSQPRAEEYDRFLDALLSMRQGRWERAHEQIAWVVPAGTLRPYALFTGAQILYELGRLSEAEWLLQQLARESPDHVDAQRLLGAIHYDLGSYDRAIVHLNFVAEREPNSAGTQRLLGLMHRDFEREAEACRHYRAALALNLPDPIRSDVVLELSESLIAQKEYEEALDVLDGSPLSLQSLALRAQCLWNVNRQDEARELVRQADDISGSDRRLCLIKLQILMQDRNWTEAIAAAGKFLDQDPHDAEIRYQLAQAYARMGRQSDYEREVAQFELSVELSNRLTELNIQAIGDPRDAVVRDELADVCDQLGKAELAEMWRASARNCREGRSLFPVESSSAAP